MMADSKFMIRAAAALLCAAGAIQPADAQDAKATAASGALDEIVVTAQRRSENIQKVPVSVQAITGETLAERSVPTLLELQRVAPSLTVQQTGCCTSPFIRGVGSVNAGGAQFGSVAVYVDGAYIGEQTAGTFDIDNAEQVQVLEGPQGALYGRNATGGAIVINSRTPHAGDPFSGRASAEYGNYNAQNFNGMVSGSFGDHWAGSISASRRKHNGYVENLNAPGTGPHNDDLNDADAWGVNGALSFEPTDRLSFVLRGSHFDQEDRGGLGNQAVGQDILIAGPLNGTRAYYAGTLQAFGVPPANAAAAALGLQFSDVIGKTYDNGRNGWQNGILPGVGLPGSFNALRMDRGSLKASYRFDNFEASSLTSYVNALNRISIDFITAAPTSYPAGLQGGAIGFSASYPTHDFQQEFQFSSIDTPIKWVGGLMYVRTTGRADLSADLPGGLSFRAGENFWSVDSKSAYGQGTIPLSGPWSFTGGARYTKETFKIIDQIDPTRPTTLPGSVNVGTKVVDSSQVTYTARFEYSSGPFLAYAGVVTGFKGATLNANNPSSAAVDPEKIRSYEAGIKWNPNDRSQLNAAVFHYKYSNVQVSYIDQASSANVLVNGSGAKVTGVQIQPQVSVTDWLKLRASGLYLKTEYDEDVKAASGTLVLLPIGGRRLGGAPKYVFNLGVDGKFAVGNGELTGSIDALKSSGYYFDALNLAGTGGASADGYTTVDVSLKYQPASGPWWVALRGANVFGEKYFQSGLVASGILREAVSATPAVFGVAVGVKF